MERSLLKAYLEGIDIVAEMMIAVITIIVVDMEGDGLISLEVYLYINQEDLRGFIYYYVQRCV